MTLSARPILDATPNGCSSTSSAPEIRPIDVIWVDDRICLNITSLGFDTKVQRRAIVLASRARWLGGLSYPLAIALALIGSREYPMHYSLHTIDGEGLAGIVEGDASFILAAICNGRYYGGGYNPSPQASLDDGRLDFCLVDSLPLLRMLSLIPLYKQGHASGRSGGPQLAGDRRQDRRAQTGLLLGNYDGESFEKAAIDFHGQAARIEFRFY